MDKLEQLVREHLANINIMQLATSVNDQPWICTVHYYSDEDLNFYWSSSEARRHSEDIRQNPKVAAAILVHENTPDENYIIGISIEGVAEFLGIAIDKGIGNAYKDKLNKEASATREFYRLKPSKIVLFDTENLSGNPRQELYL